MTATTTTLPPREASGHEYYGRAVWEWGEEGDLGVMIEGHGRRALAALNAYGRSIDGTTWRRANWAGHGHSKPVQRWVLVHTTCGCTPEEHHAVHVATDDGAGWGCPGCRPGLPPCEPGRFDWTIEHVTADTPGAVALTEVLW